MTEEQDRDAERVADAFGEYLDPVERSMMAEGIRDARRRRENPPPRSTFQKLFPYVVFPGPLIAFLVWVLLASLGYINL